MEGPRLERPDALLTAMVKASDEGEMNGDEVRAGAVLLLVAGYETDAKPVSNVLVAFELNPEQRELLVNTLDLMPAAIEEVLRWRSTVQALPRIVAKDTVLAGAELKAGDMLYALVAAANRDPARWGNPDVFDIRRERQAHFGFGYGAPLCLGAPAAPLAAQGALQRRPQTVPSVRLPAIGLATSSLTP